MAISNRLLKVILIFANPIFSFDGFGRFEAKCQPTSDSDKRAKNWQKNKKNRNWKFVFNDRKKISEEFFSGLFCFPLPSDKTSFLAAIWRQISRKASRALSRTGENKPSKMFSLIFLPKETPWLGIPGNFVFLSSLISILCPRLIVLILFNQFSPQATQLRFLECADTEQFYISNFSYFQPPYTRGRAGIESSPSCFASDSSNQQATDIF